MANSPLAPSGPSTVASLIFLFIIVSLFIAIYPLEPPAVIPSSSASGEFSAERAVAHVQSIARAPHPAGSAEHARVRAYIVGQMAALGLAPQVQTTAALHSTPRFTSGATVSNLIGRLPGSRNTKALMLAAHYDSVPGSPGASDDGSGVATLLETARALAAGPPPQNDIIFLVTDGEELGSLGAEAFVNEHDWAKEVGAVLNFESRGACGPSVMFETSAGNVWLLRRFAASVPHPVAASYMYEIYKRLPNKTDFTVFKRSGLAGLNFSYIDNWARYHTVKDDLQNLDLRSLQHDGSYALSLARNLGSGDLAQPGDGEAVYFSLLGRTLWYSSTWAVPLAVAVTLMFAGVLMLGFRKGRLSWGGISAGIAGWLAATLTSALFAYFVWRMIARTSLASLLPYGNGYNTGLYALAFLALTAAIVAGACSALRDLTASENLTAGMLIWWLAAALTASIFFPGASYLFVWPLALALPALGYLLIRKGPLSPWVSVLVWLLPALAGILLLAPLPWGLLMVMSTSNLVPLAMATAFLVGFLQPLINAMTASRRGWLTALLSGIALLLFAGAVLQRGYDADNPAADTLFYWLDTDSGKAEWISTDARPDEWTTQFLGANPQQGNLKELLGLDAPILRSPAPAASIEAPQIDVVDSSADYDIRRLRLMINAPRQARALWLEVRGADVLEAEVSGKKIGGRQLDGGMRLYYAGIREGGLALALSVPMRAHPVLTVVAQCDGLPTIPGAPERPRPASLMPSPAQPLDSTTLVAKIFRVTNDE